MKSVAFWPDGIQMVISISMQFEAGGQPPKGTDSPFPKVDFPSDVPADAAANTWFAYGYREGIPRMLDLWDRHGVNVTSHMIGEAAQHHPDPIGPEGRRGALPRLALARLSPPAPRGGRGLYGRCCIQHHPGGQDAGAGAGLHEKVSPSRSGQIGALIGERDYALHCGSSHLAIRPSCCIKVRLSSMCQLSAMRPLAMR